MGGGTHEHAADWDTGVAGVLLALQFKSGKSEYGIYISIALGMLIFASLLGKISLLKDVLNEVSNVVGLNSDYCKTLWKILGLHMQLNFRRQSVKMRGIRRSHYRLKCSQRLRFWS